MNKTFSPWYLIAVGVCCSSLATGQETTRKMAFLGVAAEPVAPDIAAHLDLPEGVGLGVREIVEDSPAASALKLHDILVRLDDQWLSDFRQLAALIRMKKPGDRVAVEFIRKGARSTATIVLGERDWAPLFAPARSDSEPILRGIPFLPGRIPRMDFGDLAADDEDAEPQRVFPIPGTGGRRAEIRIQSRSVKTEIRDGKQYSLTSTDGQNEFEVKDAEGKTLFKGPVNTPEEIEAVPQEYRDSLDRLSRGNVPLRSSPRRALRGPAL